LIIQFNSIYLLQTTMIHISSNSGQKDYRIFTAAKDRTH